VLERAREAHGFSALRERGGAVVVRGRAQLMGTEAEQTIVFDARGRLVQTFEGPLPMAQGCDGTTAWNVDWTGTPRTLELGDRSLSDVLGALMGQGWLLPDGPLELSLAGGAGDDGIALAFRHADGVIEGRLTLDRDTALLRSASWNPGGQGFAFADYMEADGVRYPAAISGDGGIAAGFEGRSLEVLPDAPDALFAPRLDPPRDVRFDPSRPAALEVLRVRTGHLLVHPTLGGEDLGWFIFDTGAGINCISTSVAERLGAEPFGEITALGVGGRTTCSFWRIGSLELGPLTVEEPLFMGLDLAFLSEPFGVEVAGILGFEFLARCVVELDVEAPSIALFDPAGYALPDGGRWEEALLYGRHPCVRATYEGHAGVFKIDTGAAGDEVTLHYAEASGLDLGARATQSSQSGGVGGTVAVRTGPLADFVLGGHTFEAVEASFALEDRGAFADAYTAGTIGGKLLAPFRLTFDYPRTRFGFVPRAGGG
jgi:predicted aspartyl protease